MQKMTNCSSISYCPNTTGFDITATEASNPVVLGIENN